MLAVHALWMVGTVPFVALLLLIAVLPLVPRTAHWWHHNSSKAIVSLTCAAATAAFIVFTESSSEAGTVVAHTLVAEFIPFIVLLGSLFVIAGGIFVRSDVKATPAINTIILAVGALSASLLGTTGASVLFIRPLLAANQHRTRVAHTVVFFIFVVSNIGGSLLPIGDPPLFLGYLRGIPFFWTLSLWGPWLFTLAVLLAIYFIIDMRMARTDGHRDTRTSSRCTIAVEGGLNVLWLAGVLASVILLIPGRALVGTAWIVPEHLREVAMVGFTLVSLATTSATVRSKCEFNWGPIVEVAVLFAGIFVSMQVPLAVLAENGAALGLASPASYFWATGSLSSFLDNAPTYLVFITAASVDTAAAAPGMIALDGGRAIDAALLGAISLGAVCMGANTYIGNGPNFMVKAMAEQSGVKMPSFFGYMGWSVAVLIPTLALVTVVFLR